MSHPVSCSGRDGVRPPKELLPISIMRLMSDYATQTLEELSALQDSSWPIGSKPQCKTDDEDKVSFSGAPNEEMMSRSADMAELPTDELRELSFRTKRIERVVSLVEQWARRQQGGTLYRGRQGHLSDPTNTQWNKGMLGSKNQIGSSRRAGSGVFSVRAHSAVAVRAIEGLHDCLAMLSTTEILSVDAKHTDENSPVIKPVARSRGLMEVAIELSSTNVRTAFRRVRKSATETKAVSSLSSSTTHAIDGTEETQESLKRPRFPGADKELRRSHTGVGNVVSSIFEEVSSSQRKQRFALYTGRVPLLPRLDALARGMAADSSTFIYLSPALRQYAALNLSAERQMLQRAWRVTSKAQLLLQLPRLYQAEEAYREQLRDISSRLGDSDGKSLLDPDRHTYFQFVHVNEGVIRVGIQHGLFVDFTYNCAGGQWIVLKLHWNVWVPAASLWFSSSVSPEATEDSSGRIGAPLETTAGASNVGVPADGCGIHIVLPQRQDVMLRFIQKNLTKGGLESGLLAANHLLCTVVIDTLAKQARQLQEHFFVSLLKAYFAVDIRPGSHLAVQLRLPIANHQVQPDDKNASAFLMNLHKFYLTGGTVLLESTTTSRNVVTHGNSNTQLLLSDASLVDRNKLLVNLEQWLWESAFSTYNAPQVASH
ncbi:unnamed protein product [Phytomonas sp. EM1]|nr:unnamed protein product [Phytomonas sp. EM1]|eukprot:CCW60394.1 unnamed protein product [Phytomonas sp. isolate EM1]